MGGAGAATGFVLATSGQVGAFVGYSCGFGASGGRIAGRGRFAFAVGTFAVGTFAVGASAFTATGA